MRRIIVLFILLFFTIGCAQNESPAKPASLNKPPATETTPTKPDKITPDPATDAEKALASAARHIIYLNKGEEYPGALIGIGDKGVVRFVTQDGKAIRMPVAGISKIGRATQGVKVIDIAAGDRVVSIARLVGEKD